MDNIIECRLDSTCKEIYTGIWQHDYGQILRITGVDLPKAVEVQFSLRDKGGDTLTRIGTTVDGVTEVKVPDSFLKNENCTQNYLIYAWIYVTDDASGNTEYQIILHVKSRPKPEEPSEEPLPEPNIFHETVEAVNASADRAEMAEQSAKGSAEKAETTLEEIKRVADGISENIENANTMKSELSDTINSAEEKKKELEPSIGKAGEAKTALDSSIRSAGEKRLALDTTVEQANAVDASLKEHIGSAQKIQANVEQIGKNTQAISSLNEDLAVLQKRQNVLVGSETGNPVRCDDAFAAPLCGLTVYGKSAQDGTPSPDAPVPIESTGDGGTIAVTLSDGNGKTQTLTLPTPTGLPGIPVTSGGNYTDPQGKQWVCDEVDLERGVKVQRVTTMVFSDSSGFFESPTDNGIRFQRAVNLKKTDTHTADANAFCSALALGDNGATWLKPDIFTITNMMLYVRFKNITSLGELQQYLQQTPMSLTAILVTPIETTLTPAELSAYKALTAYGPDTVVQASDGAGIKLDYQRDVNLVVKNLEDAIASMTAT